MVVIVTSCGFQIPDVTDVSLKNFLGLFDQTVRKKTSDLYYGRFIRTAARYSQSNTGTYIKARVSAEMTKSCI